MEIKEYRYDAFISYRHLPADIAAAEKLEALLECDSLEEYIVPMPTKTYTYLLNDIAEEFKTKPLLLNEFEEEEPQPRPEKKVDKGEKKKGFFSSLFGKK